MVYLVSSAYDLIDEKGKPYSTASARHGLIETESVGAACQAMEDWLRELHGKDLRVTFSVATPYHQMSQLGWIPSKGVDS